VRRAAWQWIAVIVGFAVAGFSLGTLAVAQLTPRRIEMTATKFMLQPTELRVRKGERVTLVLTTPDFVHGFSVPELATRVDLIPGRAVEITLPTDRAGRFVFLCDNFCGDGHDRMSGVLVVSEE
jgi:cytochrome c oxidase subunit II